MDRDEIKKISQMRELNQQKTLQIEEQISKLDQVVLEHETVFRSISQLLKTNNGTDGMIPIGAGVQIPIKYVDVDSAIIDLGSGIHAERSLEDTIQLLDKRIEELKTLIEQLVLEHETTTKTIKEIDANLNHAIKNIEQTNSNPVKENKPKRKQRRRYGGELTLDDWVVGWIYGAIW